MKSDNRNKKRDKIKHSTGGRGSSKGGAGGKGTWGVPEDDIKFLSESPTVDPRDPNFDSEDDSNAVFDLSSVEVNMDAEALFRINMEQLHEFKQNIKKATDEFLRKTHCSGDFVQRIRELHCPQHSQQIPKILMSMSFDYTEKERDLTVDLIRHIVQEKLVSVDQLAQSFNILMSRLHDLMLDVPSVCELIHEFVKKLAHDDLIDVEQAKRYYDVLGTSNDSNVVMELKKQTLEIYREYFSSESIDEIVHEIEKLNSSFFHPNIVKYGISMSLDLSNRERELMSKLLARTCDDMTKTNFFRQSEVGSGFMMLLHQLDDLHEDVPHIDRLLSFFIARAIADECLTPNFLDRIIEGDVAYPVIQRVHDLRKGKGSGERLSHVWGPDSHDVRELKTAFQSLIAEFFSSNDSQEVHRAILELGAPHFHHEFVKKIFSMCIDRGEKYTPLVAKLLKSLVQEGVIAQTEIERGFKRIENTMSDIKIDVPNAQIVFDDLKKQYQL